MPAKRKKPPEDPPKGNFELLFLQLMMIMMAFFILLSSLSVVVEKKRLDAMSSLAGAFSLMPAGANLDKGHGQSVPSRQIGASKSASMRTAKDLTRVAKLLGLGAATHVLPLDKNRVLVRLPEHMLFAAGQIELNPKIISILDMLSDILHQPEIQKITIEGHTDEMPMQTPGIADNWDLSAARAMQVFRHLAARGVPRSRMIVAGMGDAHPLPEKETKGNNALNRRVELLIRFRPTTVKNVNMLSPDTRPVSKDRYKGGR